MCTNPERLGGILLQESAWPATAVGSSRDVLQVSARSRSRAGAIE